MTNQAAEALKNKKNRLEAEINELERMIYDLESEYFGQSEVTAFGTVTKGLEGYLTSKNAQLKTKGRSFQVEDRLFSLSSAKSQATKDHHMQKTFGDDGFDGRRSSARKKWLGES